MKKNTRVLFILSNHDRLTEIIPTGVWLEEYVKPLKMIREKGAEVVVASPNGGRAPIDPKSLEGFDREPYQAEIGLINDTKALETIEISDFDAVFFPGGHGPIFDLPSNRKVQELLKAFDSRDKPIAAVCHGVAALLATRRDDGSPLVYGRKVTGFADSEEEASGLSRLVPYLVEGKIRELGGRYSKATEDFACHVVEDGPYITGQNPASAGEVAERLIRRLEL